MTATATDTIPGPGLYAGDDWIHPDDYHASERLSRSDLLLLLKSPAAYKGAKDRPQPPTRPMIRGDALHAAILEPERFNREYVFPPEGLDRRTKAGKAAWADFLAQSNGQKIVGYDPERGALYTDDVAIVRELSAAVRSKPVVQRILQGAGDTEATFAWDREDVGLRARADRRIKGRDGKWRIVDFKSTQDCTPHAFNKAVARYGYHVQAALYAEGAQAVTGEKHEFTFVVYETEHPYVSAIYDLDPEYLEIGRHAIRMALDRYRECMASGEWPDLSDKQRTLMPPRWLWEE